MLSRRDFLGAAALVAVVPVPRVLAQPAFDRYPFSLGVASGYPAPDGVVLWTRLAPEPTSGGGLRRGGIEVAWEVAEDEAFRKIVRSGKEAATPQWAHSVHAEVAGLEPARPYFYRFHVGATASPVGRTRTAPAAGSAPDRLRLAFASCQAYEHGYYTAYRHMAAENPDLVVHLGDYIYETSWGRNHVRKHGTPETYTLYEYRNRYALYKSDADLQAAHAAAPWIVTWDDHEVQNDYANDRSQFDDPRRDFLARRAAAYQAYYEHMPLPRRMQPRGHDMQIYTRWDYGTLARIHLLDDRQYRDYQACPSEKRGGGSNVVTTEICPELRRPGRSILGAAQEQWLEEGLGGSAARWNVIAQQTVMAQVDRRPGPEQAFWTDGWDGYPAAREKLLRFIAGKRVANPIVIGGDVHTAVVADLKIDFDDAKSPVVATEFTGTSITSQGISPKTIETWRSENSHIHYADSARRGYTTLELTPQRCTTRMRTVNEKVADSTVRTQAAWAVEDGKPGAQPDKRES
jgi:alkaline phosphatase D